MNGEKKKLLIQYEIIKDRNTLDPSERELIDKATEAAMKAYAPYSGFFVGAAIRLSDGRIVTGSNQENAAYPSGLCAERVAAFAAGSNFPEQKMLTIAISARKKGRDFLAVTPCGSCRQVLLEYEKKQQSPIRILLAGKDSTILVFDRAGELLPFGFDRSHL